MKITALASLLACLAITASAGGAGGHGGNIKGPHSKSVAHGNGGSAGKQHSGSAKGGKAGGGGTIGTQQASTKAGGNSGEVIDIFNDQQYFYGSVGTNQGSSVTGGSSQGGSSGSISQISKPHDIVANGGSGNGISGAVKGGTGGAGPKSGSSGHNTGGSPKAGAGGKGGNPNVAVSVPVSATIPMVPGRRSVESAHSGNTEEITELEIIQAIQNNQRLPDPIEHELPNSAIGKTYHIPQNRKPASPVHSAKTTDAAIALLKQGTIPPSVIAALDKVWPKKSTNQKPVTHAGKTAGSYEGRLPVHQAQHSAQAPASKPEAANLQRAKAPGRRALAFQA